VRELEFHADLCNVHYAYSTLYSDDVIFCDVRNENSCSSFVVSLYYSPISFLCTNAHICIT